MNDTTRQLLEIISDFDGEFKGAYNIREDGQCAARESTENIKIESKKDAPGLVIHIKPHTKGEKVYIPACVTKSGIDDLVYNDFYVGEGADVTIVAGCGVHTTGVEEARHNGIHRFILEKDANVLYQEKHIGTGKQEGIRRIDPVTDVELGENSKLTMDTVQLSGVDYTTRTTRGVLGDGARLIIKERIMTDGKEQAKTDFYVELKGENSGVDLMSRSVARDESYQEYHSVIKGMNVCTGHSECDAILVGNGKVSASPQLDAEHPDAALIHEAAIGKIAGEQILKLRTLGLTEEEAEQKIISGFLK
ncbi:SufD family Fe-S cluster assembly protein [Ruminococcus sp. FC2018]|uniref:SufB/SufD family protein n=1 Tax=Ruminococcus sp. FC2018 TaxID=1410617 RepID=UPI000491A92F|nr:SufD family Fe-S cluster assembly protein [Ruminococcus sp. FC2018]